MSFEKFHGFDGWLFNVGVILSFGLAAAPYFVSLVVDITRACGNVVSPVSEVSWYDNITRDGSLAS